MAAKAEEVFQSEPKVVNKPRKSVLGLIVLVAVYVLSPIDLLPEALIGPLGFLDDAALVTFLVRKILKRQ